MAYRGSPFGTRDMSFETTLDTTRDIATRHLVFNATFRASDPTRNSTTTRHSCVQLSYVASQYRLVVRCA